MEYPEENTEKRTEHRYRYLAEISYGSGHNIGNGFVQDLSLGGMLISAMHKIPIGTEVLITVPFPKSPRYASLHGKVTRLTEEGFAITFKRKQRYKNFDNGYWEL